MRNLKRALSLALASVMLLGMMVVGTSAASYTDVASTDNVEAIEVLKAVGVMEGDDKGNFNPDQKVTRNEMAVVMANMLDLKVNDFSATSISFTDVPTWAAKYVAACKADGIISGYSDTTFGGSDTVTAAQSALMMLKALGYFQFASDFGDDWQLATVKQASSIELFDGIDASATTALTRNDVARLALNALEATMVEPDGNGGITVEGDGFTVTTGKVKYEDQTTTKYDYTRNNGTYVANVSENTLQLCEKLYGKDLIKTAGASDDFGRPSTKWKYEKDEVGTYSDEADATYTAKVKVKTIYSDLGLTENITATTLTNGGSASTQLIKKGDSTEIGARGQLTEVYYDSDNDSIEIVFIDTYVGKVAAVFSNVDDPYVTVTAKSAGAPNGEFETTAFEKDDIVLYTYADGEIQTLALAEKVEDQELTSFTGTGSTSSAATKLVAGGTTYNTTNTAKHNEQIANDNSYDLYLDAYGNVIYTELYSGDANNYAYVLDTGTKSGIYTGDTDYYAKLLLADGTKIDALTDKDYGTAYNASTAPNGGGNFEQHIVTYSINDDDEYVLTDKAAAQASKTVTLTPGTSKVTVATGTDFYANSKTVFVVAETSGSDTDYAVYTGIANAPKIAGATVAQIANYGSGSVAEYVFMEVASSSISGTSDDIIFVKGATKSASDVITSGTTTYYAYTAFVDGEETELKVLTTASSAISTLQNNVFLKSITTNSKGYVTSVAAYQTSGDIVVVSGSDGTKAEDNGAVGFNYGTPAWYSYAEDVAVYVRDGSDVSVGSIASVNDDANDSYLAVVDSGEIIALAIIKTATPAPTSVSVTATNASLTLSGGTASTNLTASATVTGTVSYSWATTGGTLASGNTGTTTSNTITFTAAGTYTVTLTARNTLADGSSATATATVVITVAPEP